MNCIFYRYENVVFPAQAAEYFYFSVDFRLKIFLNWVVAYGISTLECIVSIVGVLCLDLSCPFFRKRNNLIRLKVKAYNRTVFGDFQFILN